MGDCQSVSPPQLGAVIADVWRQLLFPVDDNYFSRSTTITSCSKTGFLSKLELTGAEGKALQGCNLSADSGARPGGADLAPPNWRNNKDLGWQESDRSRRSGGRAS